MRNASRRTQVIVGAVTLVVVGIATYFVFNGAALLNSGAQRYDAEFSSVLNIIPNSSEVRINGVEVGSVQAVGEDLETSTGVVTIGIDDPDIVLHTDAQASLKLKSFLGEKYVDIDPGSPDAPVLAPGSRLALEQNEGTADLGSLLGAGTLLSDIPAEDLTETLSLSAQSIERSGSDMAGLVTGLRNGLDSMVARKDELFGMLDNTDQMLSTIVAQQSTFSRISANMRTTQVALRTFLRGHKTELVGIMNDLQRIQNVLGANKAILKSTMDRGFAQLHTVRVIVNMLMENLTTGCYPIPISMTNFGILLDRDIRPGDRTGPCYPPG
ncbi:MAG: MlaD family protein [Acidimicrobiia bacterium]|nr:MlaD family protein [Acidimicrobiia bacterium]